MPKLCLHAMVVIKTDNQWPVNIGTSPWRTSREWRGIPDKISLEQRSEFALDVPLFCFLLSSPATPAKQWHTPTARLTAGDDEICTRMNNSHSQEYHSGKRYWVRIEGADSEWISVRVLEKKELMCVVVRRHYALTWPVAMADYYTRNGLGKRNKTFIRRGMHV